MPMLKPGANLKLASPATNFVDRIRAGRVVQNLRGYTVYEPTMFATK